MAFTVRVSLPGNDALTETNTDKFALYADADNILIKEERRGTVSLAFNELGTVSHNLGYVPLYLVYSEVSAGRYRINNSFDPVGGGWRAYSGTANLVIENRYGGTAISRYFVFYDNIGSTL